MRLNQASVKWWWLDEYLKENPEPENTDLLAVPPILPTYAHFRKAIEIAQQQEKERSDLAVAVTA